MMWFNLNSTLSHLSTFHFSQQQINIKPKQIQRILYLEKTSCVNDNYAFRGI